MPSVSPKQHRLMQAAAHDPEFAGRVKIPQRVAREFVEADKGKIKKKSQRSNPIRKASPRGR